MAQRKRLTYYEQRGNKMTLQKMVDILQTWAHHGHAQNEVIVEMCSGEEELEIKVENHKVRLIFNISEK